MLNGMIFGLLIQLKAILQYIETSQLISLQISRLVSIHESAGQILVSAERYFFKKLNM